VRSSRIKLRCSARAFACAKLSSLTSDLIAAASHPYSLNGSSSASRQVEYVAVTPTPNDSLLMIPAPSVPTCAASVATAITCEPLLSGSDDPAIASRSPGLVSVENPPFVRNQNGSPPGPPALVTLSGPTTI